jgi:hypothetical protein
MVLVGRLLSPADCHEGRERRHHIDDGFQRIGIKRDRTGEPPGEKLQRHHREGDTDGAQCQPANERAP